MHKHFFLTCADVNNFSRFILSLQAKESNTVSEEAVSNGHKENGCHDGSYMVPMSQKRSAFVGSFYCCLAHGLLCCSLLQPTGKQENATVFGHTEASVDIGSSIFLEREEISQPPRFSQGSSVPAPGQWGYHYSTSTFQGIKSSGNVSPGSNTKEPTITGPTQGSGVQAHTVKGILNTEKNANAEFSFAGHPQTTNVGESLQQISLPHTVNILPSGSNDISASSTLMSDHQVPILGTP